MMMSFTQLKRKPATHFIMQNLGSFLIEPTHTEITMLQGQSTSLFIKKHLHSNTVEDEAI